MYNAYQKLLKGLANMLQVFHGISKCMASSSVDTSSDSSVAMHPDTNSTAASTVIDDDDSNVLRIPFTISFIMGQATSTGWLQSTWESSVFASLSHAYFLPIYHYHQFCFRLHKLCTSPFFLFYSKFRLTPSRLGVNERKKRILFQLGVFGSPPFT